MRRKHSHLNSSCLNTPSMNYPWAIFSSLILFSFYSVSAIQVCKGRERAANVHVLLRVVLFTQSRRAQSLVYRDCGSSRCRGRGHTCNTVICDPTQDMDTCMSNNVKESARSTKSNLQQFFRIIRIKTNQKTLQNLYLFFLRLLSRYKPTKVASKCNCSEKHSGDMNIVRKTIEIV